MSISVTCQRCGYIWSPRKEHPVQCPACHSAWWNRPRTGRTGGTLSYFRQAFAALNSLKRRRIITDWALYDAVGYIYYEEVIVTRDVDVFVSVRVESDYYKKVLKALRSYGPMVSEAATFQIGALLVQVFPATGHPLWEDVVRSAVKTRVGGEPVKVASREHLIILALLRFHPARDVPRIGQLYPNADKQVLASLLRRFDENGQLAKRLGKVVQWLE